MEQFLTKLKKISRSFRKKRVLHFNLYLISFIGLKFVADYVNITHIDTLYRNLIKMKLNFNIVVDIRSATI